MLLLEQGQYIGAGLVSLCQHGLCSLQQNIVLGVVGHFLSHISITNSGFRGLNILRCSGQVARGVFQTGLNGTNGGLLVKSLLDCVIQNIDSSICLGLSGDVQLSAICTLQTKSLSTHVGKANLNGLISLGTNLQADSIVLRLILSTNSLLMHPKLH